MQVDKDLINCLKHERRIIRTPNSGQAIFSFEKKTAKTLISSTNLTNKDIQF